MSMPADGTEAIFVLLERSSWELLVASNDNKIDLLAKMPYAG